MPTTHKSAISRALLWATRYRLLLILLACPALPSHAQWAVVDIDAIAGITHQVQQGAQQIQQLQQQYNQMKAMAVQAKGLFHYRGPQNIFQAISYADQYATLADWAAGGASGDLASVQAGYQKNTTLANIDTSLAKLNTSVARSRSSLYATQTIMDGNNMAAMQAVGQIRAASAQYKNAISALEDDSEDDDDEVQSQLAVSQRTANASVLGLRAQQDTNNLLSLMLNQQLTQTKMSRDTIADGTNRALADQQALDDSGKLTTGYTTSLQNWSLE